MSLIYLPTPLISKSSKISKIRLTFLDLSLSGGS